LELRKRHPKLYLFKLQREQKAEGKSFSEVPLSTIQATSSRRYSIVVTPFPRCLFNKEG
jgi:hypothetical protein